MEIRIYFFSKEKCIKVRNTDTYFEITLFQLFEILKIITCRVLVMSYELIDIF